MIISVYSNTPFNSVSILLPNGKIICEYNIKNKKVDFNVNFLHNFIILANFASGIKKAVYFKNTDCVSLSVNVSPTTYYKESFTFYLTDKNYSGLPINSATLILKG